MGNLGRNSSPQWKSAYLLQLLGRLPTSWEGPDGSVVDLIGAVRPLISRLTTTNLGSSMRLICESKLRSTLRCRVDRAREENMTHATSSALCSFVCFSLTKLFESVGCTPRGQHAKLTVMYQVSHNHPRAVLCEAHRLTPSTRSSIDLELPYDCLAVQAD